MEACVQARRSPNVDTYIRTTPTHSSHVVAPQTVWVQRRNRWVCVGEKGSALLWPLETRPVTVDRCHRCPDHETRMLHASLCTTHARVVHVTHEDGWMGQGGRSSAPLLCLIGNLGISSGFAPIHGRIIMIAKSSFFTYRHPRIESRF